FENFDEDVHDRLKLRLADAHTQLDRFGRRFWDVSKFILATRARFDETNLAFELFDPPKEEIPRGNYRLISKTSNKVDTSVEAQLYRLSHPLGEFVIEAGKKTETPY